VTSLTIGPSVILITTATNQNDVFGQNAGKNTIYLSELPDVSSANNSLILTAGNTFTWPAGKNLYGITATGAASTLTYTNNGATMGISSVSIAGGVTVGGSVDIPAGVAINGTTAVAGAVSVPAGVAINGTTAVAGAVSVPAGVAINGTTAVAGAVSVPAGVVSKSVNNVTLLYSGSIAITGAAQTNGVGPNAPILDASGYSSILLCLDIVTVGPAFPVLASNYLEGIILLSDVNTLATQPTDQNFQPQWLLVSADSLAGHQSIQVPVTRRYFGASVTIYKALTNSSGTLNVKIYGSNEVITTPKYISQGWGLSGAMPRGKSYYSAVTAATLNDAIASTNSATTAQLITIVGSAIGSGRINSYQSGVAVPLAHTSTAGPVSGSFYAPCYPLALVLNESAAGNTLGISITQNL
jgi:hypothetical protein